MDRRNFLAAMLAGCAAPAVVKVGSLMRIKPIVLLEDCITVSGPIAGMQGVYGVEYDIPDSFFEAVKYGLGFQIAQPQGRVAPLKDLWPALNAEYERYFESLATRRILA